MQKSPKELKNTRQSSLKAKTKTQCDSPPQKHYDILRPPFNSRALSLILSGIVVSLRSLSSFSFVRKLLDDLQSEVESLHRKQQHVLSLAIADPSEKVQQWKNISNLIGNRCFFLECLGRPNHQNSPKNRWSSKNGQRSRQRVQWVRQRWATTRL